MYDSNQLLTGAGLLVALWAAVGVIIVSSGVAVSVPLSGGGGFTVAADYLSAERSVSTPGETDSTAENRRPTAVFELSESTATDLRVQKTLAVDQMPGLNGNIRLGIRSGRAEIEGVVLKTDRLQAERAVFRGFVIDERNRDSIFDQFVATAGPNPQEIAGNPVDVEGSGDEPGIELQTARIEAYSLTADRAQLSNLNLVVAYDPDDDGTYEYGS
jgi:hypothetical protein